MELSNEFKDIKPPLQKTEEQIWQDSLFYKIDLFDHLIIGGRTDCIKKGRQRSKREKLEYETRREKLEYESRKEKQSKERRPSDFTCFNCGQQDHQVKNCPKKSNRSSEKRRQRREKWQLKQQVKQFIEEQRQDHDNHDNDKDDEIIKAYDKEYYNPRDYEKPFDEKTRKIIKEAFEAFETPMDF